MFLPTVFKPRASCVAAFPNTGEYTIAVWAADGTKGTNHYNLGLGLKERDVFAMENLLLADFNMLPMLMWNHWNPFVVILPMIICFAATQYLLVHLSKNSSDPPSVFQWILSSAGSIIIGQVIFNIINLIWCRSISDSGGEEVLAIVAGILIPLFNGGAVYLAAFMCKSENGRMCKNSETPRNVCRRVTAGLIGFFHIFGWHAGYLIAPISLLIAAMLPTQFADKIIKQKKIDENQT